LVKLERYDEAFAAFDKVLALKSDTGAALIKPTNVRFAPIVIAFVRAQQMTRWVHRTTFQGR
jgi:hypothetical protein